ncbi:hypothetical protein ACGF0J_21760 [Nonomuraea sp. NPDC047897]|uniref:hypothetical protein n=1 Tax=Nonomuraea sp. NPDC047897 TaxID=3364346 RepID=UPI003720D9D1
MRYALIDNDDELHIKDGDWRAELGPEGPAQVRLPSFGAIPVWSGWVNDDGHRLGLPRNLVGGLVLTGLGASVWPYAGPIAITGWDLHGLPTEVCDLDDDQITTIRDCHTDARAAMAGAPGLRFRRAREVAEKMRTAPTPSLTIMSGAELLEYLRGRS